MPDEQNNPVTEDERERAARLAGWTPEVSEETPDDHGLPSGDDIVEVNEISPERRRKPSEGADRLDAQRGAFTTTVQEVLDEMQSAVGFVEQPGNRNPWGEEQFGGDAAYCCSFACMIPYHHGYRWWPESQFGEKGDAYCPFRMNHAQDHGEYQADRASEGRPADVQPGDQLLYDWNNNGAADHIETCMRANVDDTTTNIGANTGSPEGVYLLTRTRKYLLGRIRPSQYSRTAPPHQPSFEEKIRMKPTLQLHSKGENVKIMQALLIAHADDLMHDKDVDGDFGPHTQDVLRAWQGRTKVLAPDGVCGPATWAWLCGVR
jgi:peptidoglycan hydrolase-like protein with peptidoglycan-binding domain